MKKIKFSLPLFVVFAVFFFKSQAQSSIVVFDFESYYQSGQGLLHEEIREIETYKEEFSKAKSDDEKVKLNSKIDKLYESYTERVKNQILNKAKEKNIDYLFKKSSNLCVLINQQIYFNSNPVDFNNLKIGHIDFESYSKNLKNYSQTQAKIKSMHKIIDSLSNQYSAEKNTQKRADVYTTFLEAQSTLKKIEDKFNLDVISEIIAISKSKGYDFIFDSSKNEILFSPEKNIFDDENPIKEIKIGHINYVNLFEKAPKIKSDLEKLEILDDKWHKSTNSTDKNLYWEQKEVFRKKLFGHIKTTAIDAAKKNNLDYVLIMNDNKPGFFPINGYDLFNDIKNQYQNL